MDTLIAKVTAPVGTCILAGPTCSFFLTPGAVLVADIDVIETCLHVIEAGFSLGTWDIKVQTDLALCRAIVDALPRVKVLGNRNAGTEK
jgi:hypothetical protein